VLTELDCLLASAAAERGRCRVRNRRGQVLVWPLCSERQVPCAQLAVRDGGGQFQVQAPPLARHRAPSRCRREQRVRRPNPVAFDHEHPGCHGVLDRGHGGNSRQLVGTEVGAQRHRQEQLPDGRRQPGHTCAQQVLDRIGHGEVLAGPRQPALGQ
jgi:hypothetical protein